MAGAPEGLVKGLEAGFKASRGKGKAGEVIVLYGQGETANQTVVLVGTGEGATTPAITEAAQNKLKVSSHFNSTIDRSFKLIEGLYERRRNHEEPPH